MLVAKVAALDRARWIKDCKAELERVRQKPALAGAPALEARRAELLARAKAEPVLFWRPPLAPRQPSPEASVYLTQILRSATPGYTLSGIYKHLHRRPALARELLLREGYLYADDPDLGSFVAERVELQQLFDDPVVYLQRGAEVYRAVRGEDSKYRYESGPDAGKRARLWLFDRVWSAEDALPSPLHFDVRGLARRLGFEQLRVLRVTDGEITAELRYGSHWVQTLLRSDGPNLERVCEVIPSASRAIVDRAKSITFRKERVWSLKRRAIVEQIEASLPFDEPKTEDGQQDGNLRPAWIWAYTHGLDSYRFNDDRYPVFDVKGRPAVPQVCVDFIIDTLELASGTRWREKGAERERVRGQLDFAELGIANRRSVDNFVQFARQHPAWFDVYELLPEERIPFRRRQHFFEHLHTHADRYAPGDIVVIHGLKDDEEWHYHSFFVHDADPLSGMPMSVAANAGRPRIRTWESEMRSAPRRSIRMRVRPRLEWLESVLPSAPSMSRNAKTAGEPLPG